MDNNMHEINEVISVEDASIKSIQSADSFFHFVDKFDYLKDIIKKKRFYPRYCKESLKDFNIGIDDIMVLMKCFCVIPLHNVYSHKEEYGDYCIGMTKKWGLEKGLQPVFYYNKKSEFPSVIRKSFEVAMKYAGNDNYINEIAEVLNFNLKYQKNTYGYDPKIEKHKDFSDEKEWRFVPSIKDGDKISEIILEKGIIDKEKIINEYNNLVIECNCYIEFEYSDIRYLFVNDADERKKLIKIIQELEIEENEKDILLTRICVWNEMENDF